MKDSKEKQFALDNLEVGLGAGLSLDPALSIDTHIEGAKTNHHHFSFSAFALRARSQLTNDLVGDPFSSMVGLEFRRVSHLAVTDRSLPYHGKYEIEGQLSIGKEETCGPTWLSRKWLALGLGIVANEGCPWLQLQLYFEKNLCDVGSWGAFVKGGAGFGNHRLHLKRHFDGYSHIRYRTVDVGAFFTRKIGDFGTLEADYSFRVFARNYPAYVSTFLVQLTIPWAI